MKATCRRERHLSGNRFTNAILHHMLKGNDAGRFSGNGKKSGHAPYDFPSQKKIAHAARSANDLRIRKLEESVAGTGAILPAEAPATDQTAAIPGKALCGAISITSVLPLGHRLVIAYIISLQPDSHMAYVSPQIANLGFSPETWIGNPDLRLQRIYKEDLGRVTAALQHTRDSSEKFDCCYRLYDSAEKIRWFHDQASVVCDESGSPLFISGAMLDITDKKEMEAELEEHRYCLEQHVELRTRQLMKRITLLESCNAKLCDQIASVQNDLAALRKQHAAYASQAQPTRKTLPVRPEQTASPTPTSDCTDQLDGISTWARNMIGWRVAAAGSIS